MDRAQRIDGKTAAIKPPNETNSPPVVTFCGIAFMAKASVPGRAKTRLVPPLTFDDAAALNTAFLKDVAANVLSASRSSATAGIAGYAAYGPPGSRAFFESILPPSIGLIEAWSPNFGDCLFHTIGELFARGHRAAIVLNSDSPTLPTALLIEAAELLSRPGDRAVLGPSNDGGYYLLGLKTAHHRMFEDITWSTELVAEQTLQRARELALPVHRLPLWYDVDDVDALCRLYAELCDVHRRSADGQIPHEANNTAALMHSLAGKHGLTTRRGHVMQVDEVRA